MKYFLKALQNYATFSGRASRSEYWFFFLFNVVFAMLVGFIAGAIRIPMLYMLYVLAMLLPGIAVAVRRMHDVNKSGWYSLIPIYNLVLALTEGTNGPNQYGPDPLHPEIFEEIEQIGSN